MYFFNLYVIQTQCMYIYTYAKLITILIFSRCDLLIKTFTEGFPPKKLNENY